MTQTRRTVYLQNQSVVDQKLSAQSASIIDQNKVEIDAERHKVNQVQCNLDIILYVIAAELVKRQDRSSDLEEEIKLCAKQRGRSIPSRPKEFLEKLNRTYPDVDSAIPFQDQINNPRTFANLQIQSMHASVKHVNKKLDDEKASHEQTKTTLSLYKNKVIADMIIKEKLLRENCDLTTQAKTHEDAIAQHMEEINNIRKAEQSSREDLEEEVRKVIWCFNRRMKFSNNSS